MNLERIKTLFRYLGSPHTSTRGKWVSGHCPLGPWKHEGGTDKHPSFAIQVSKQRSKCKCLSCGFGGDLDDLRLVLHHYEKKNPTGRSYKEAVQLIATELDDSEFDPTDVPDYGESTLAHDLIFPEFWLESFQSVWKFPHAVQYLKDRNLADETIKALDVRFDPLDRRVVFPYRDKLGQLVGAQGRAIGPNPLRYLQYGYNGVRNPLAWMGEDTVDLDKPIVLVEGPFDYAAVWQVYPNVLASFTSGISWEKCARIGDAEEVITFYDYGKGGVAARDRLTKFFKKVPIIHLTPSEEEGDPGAMTGDSIKKLLDEINLL